MIEGILKLGRSGGAGALIGMLAVWWVEPTTGGGTALLVVVGIIFGVTIGSVVSQFVESKKHPAIAESVMPAVSQQPPKAAQPRGQSVSAAEAASPEEPESAGRGK